MLNEIVDSDKCFGCGACLNICPRKAILMQPNEEGFLHPLIDHDVCVECNLCRAVCPARLNGEHNATKIAYALQHIDESVRLKSTSGAAFIALSDVILNEGGVIYGVVYDSSFKAVHYRATDKADRDRMRGSKYVQSDIGQSFTEVLADLKQGKHILFTGTSCQIDGLISYLSKRKIDTSTLVTCDIICHGVPSPQIWKEHIKHLEKTTGKKILYYSNRSKVDGWHAHNEHITYIDGSSEWFSKKAQNFKDLFYGHYIVRECCHSCPYVSMHSRADFTIADFWGCEDLHPEIDDNKGTSIVLLNSDKAVTLFEKVRPFAKTWEVKLSYAIKFNHIKATKANSDRSQFWEDYQSHGFEFVVKKYAQDSFFGRIKYYSKKIIRKIFVKLGLIHI